MTGQADAGCIYGYGCRWPDGCNAESVCIGADIGTDRAALALGMADGMPVASQPAPGNVITCPDCGQRRGPYCTEAEAWAPPS